MTPKNDTSWVRDEQSARQRPILLNTSGFTDGGWLSDARDRVADSHRHATRRRHARL
jgi:hypothetical protein